MGSRDRRTGIVGKLAVTAGLVVGTAALAGFGGPVSAQQPDSSLPRPTASAVAQCVGETGRIVVTIVDNEPYRYRVTIGGTVVAANIPDGDGGINVFEPYADGAYPVVVEWIAPSGNEQAAPFNPPVEVLSTTVTVDCLADVTTTALPTTVPATIAPVTSTPTVAPPATTAPAAVTLPATGRASRTVATLAGLLTLAGGVLLVARRPDRA